MVVAGPPAALEALSPLVEAYRAGGRDVLIRPAPEIPSPERLLALAGEGDALLLVGDRRRSPRTALPGPAVEVGGRHVPVGWLPDTGAEAVRVFAEGAARVHRSSSGDGQGNLPGQMKTRGGNDGHTDVEGDGQGRGTPTVALLSQWEPRYLRLTERVRASLAEGDGGPSTFIWSSDLVLREDLTEGLGCGLGVALYLGHGRPIGWVGYRGFRVHHLPDRPAHPLGLLFSLCCVTASRRRTSLSFSEAAALRGSAAAAIGAVDDTLHTQNGRLAVRVAAALRDGARTVADLVGRLLEPSPEALAPYRLIGDPLAPLGGTPGALGAAARIPCFP